MSQEPFPYASPVIASQEQPPACIAVISIIGIVLGSLGLLMRFIGLAFLTLTRLAPNAAKVPNQGPVATAAQILISVVFIGFGVWLITASIASLKRKEWGRVWLIRWATIYSAALVIDCILTIAVFLPMGREAADATMKNSGSPISASTVSMIAAGGAVFSLIILLILPIFVMVFFRKLEVRAAFSNDVG